MFKTFINMFCTLSRQHINNLNNNSMSRSEYEYDASIESESESETELRIYNEYIQNKLKKKNRLNN